MSDSDNLKKLLQQWTTVQTAAFYVARATSLLPSSAIFAEWNWLFSSASSVGDAAYDILWALMRTGSVEENPADKSLVRWAAKVELSSTAPDPGRTSTAAQRRMSRTLLRVLSPTARLDPRVRTTQLRRALLQFGSETPDNSAAMERIEWGVERGASEWSRDRYGIVLSEGGVALSQVAHCIEEVSFSEVSAKMEGLSEDDWHAATRVISLILMALEVDEEHD